MEFLINPNIAYLLFIAAFLLLLVSIIIPGTGIPEAAFVLCVMLAGYMAYQLGINLWAVALLISTLIPFWLGLRLKKGLIPFLVISILLLTVGSIFLFTNEQGVPHVNPVLAVIVSICSGGFIWLLADRSTKALHQTPVHNLDALIGQIGEARTDIHAEGSVQVGGELWSARSEKMIEAGKPVHVVERHGLILTVKEETTN